MSASDSSVCFEVRHPRCVSNKSNYRVYVYRYFAEGTMDNGTRCPQCTVDNCIFTLQTQAIRYHIQLHFTIETYYVTYSRHSYKQAQCSGCIWFLTKPNPRPPLPHPRDLALIPPPCTLHPPPTDACITDKFSLYNLKLANICGRNMQLCFTYSKQRTYLLTPWNRVLLEKLTGSAASQEIPRIFGTPRFITVLTSARHLSLS